MVSMSSRGCWGGEMDCRARRQGVVSFLELQGTWTSRHPGSKPMPLSGKHASPICRSVSRRSSMPADTVRREQLSEDMGRFFNSRRTLFTISPWKWYHSVHFISRLSTVDGLMSELSLVKGRGGFISRCWAGSANGGARGCTGRADCCRPHRSSLLLVGLRPRLHFADPDN